MRAAALVLAVATSALGPGCAFGDGQPFGTLEATLDVHLEVPADRDLGDGFQKLASDWQVRVVRLDLVVDTLVVEGSAGSSAPSAEGAAFDPANPPPGYSLCHGGHCHADDGRLVPYAEIAAELAGGSDGAAPLAAVLEVGTIPVVGGGRRALDCTDCALDEGHLTGVRLIARHLEVELEVRDGRPAPRIDGAFTVRGTIDLGVAAADGGTPPGELRVVLDAPIDDDTPPVVALALSLTPSVALLDRVDFTTLPASGGALDLGPAAEGIRAAFATLDLDAHVTRRDD